MSVWCKSCADGFPMQLISGKSFAFVFRLNILIWKLTFNRNWTFKNKIIACSLYLKNYFFSERCNHCSSKLFIDKNCSLTSKRAKRCKIDLKWLKLNHNDDKQKAQCGLRCWWNVKQKSTYYRYANPEERL